MGYQSNTGLNVSNFYGARDTTSGTGVGVEHSDDSVHQLSISFSGTSLNDTFMPPVVVPKGALFKRAILRVDEAFTLGGTTPAVSFGAVGAETTNGISLSQAELQAIGTKTPASTGAGTWAQGSSTGVTAAAKVGKAFSGTAPTVTTGVGKATLTLEFFNKTKV